MITPRSLLVATAVWLLTTGLLAQQEPSPFTGQPTDPRGPAPDASAPPTPTTEAPEQPAGAQPPPPAAQPPPPAAQPPPPAAVQPQPPPPAGPRAPAYPPGTQPPAAYPPPPYGAPPPPYEPPPPENPWPSAPEKPWRKRFRLAISTDAAFGVDEGPFYNHLAGLRGDFRFSERSSLGIYVGYANLKGLEKRAHNVLGMPQFEYRFPFGQVAIPLRAGIGYIPNNGAVLRLAIGIYFQLNESWDVGIDLLAPMFWGANNDSYLSLNLAPEAAISF